VETAAARTGEVTAAKVTTADACAAAMDPSEMPAPAAEMRAAAVKASTPAVESSTATAVESSPSAATTAATAAMTTPAAASGCEGRSRQRDRQHKDR
jgi:hypothetical protein